MDFEFSFPGLYGSRKPPLEQIASLFLVNFPNAWTEDADVTCFLADGGFNRLSIVANPRFGIWLWYKMVDPNGEETNYMSLGDPKKLDTYVDAVEDALTLEGFYLPPDKAWLAVEDFIRHDGKRSEKVSWLREDLVPEGKPWLVSVDCL